MPAIQFSHANGFPAKTYSFLFKQLDDYNIHYVNAFGLNQFKVKKNWYPLIDELILDIEKHGNHPLVGVGHSLGSVLTYWAAQRRPDLFTRVIMLDPPYLPWLFRAALGTLGPAGLMEHLLPIARNAKKRRDTFMSEEEAFNYWKSKPLFRNFHPECFSDYVSHTLVNTPNGNKTLLIPRELEARIFSLTAWRLGQNKSEVPVYWLVPENSVVPSSTMEKHKQAFPGINFVPIKGGHMFPLEHPFETAEAIDRLIHAGKI